ncbi:MAG: RIP metalloprotease RseP [Capnocytophaga sp.]|nr:RIP metalloprotease RseP [Capnocytophaga sp.]
METFFIKASQLLLSLSILVILHELGHFIPAKLFKTRVEKFFLFFDVKFALFKKKIGETVYGIGWLPLGGYVKISGMIDESMDKEQMAKPAEPWEFRSKPAWQRLIIMIGGVTVNLILGFFIYMMILFVWGKDEFRPADVPNGYEVSATMQSYGVENGDIPVKVNGEDLEDTFSINKILLLRDVKNISVKKQSGEIQTINLPDSIGMQLFHSGEMISFHKRRTTEIDSVLAGSVAEKAGLQKGDFIVGINGNKIAFFDEMKKFLPKEDNPITLQIVRNKEVKDISLTPEKGLIGVYAMHFYDNGKTHIDYSFTEAIAKGFSFGVWTLRDYVSQFKFIFTKKGAEQVGGFGSMAKMFAAEWDWLRFWERTALISIILAFMNILPIPALDGGHIVFLLYEMVTGRKPKEKVLEYAQVIGIILLFALLIYANGNDIYRWLIKD